MFGVMLLAMSVRPLSSALADVGQEVLTASILIAAVLMSDWRQISMAGHGREIAQKMKAMGHAVASGRKSLLAMGVVVAIAVVCEGAEVVLSLYGIAVSSTEGQIPLPLAVRLGLASAQWSLGCCIVDC
jgi:high-affinity iron transporter